MAGLSHPSARVLFTLKFQPCCLKYLIMAGSSRGVLFLPMAGDSEIACNAMRPAGVPVKKGNGVSLFMPGTGVLFAQSSRERFSVTR